MATRSTCQREASCSRASCPGASTTACDLKAYLILPVFLQVIDLFGGTWQVTLLLLATTWSRSHLAAPPPRNALQMLKR